MNVTLRTTIGLMGATLALLAAPDLASAKGMSLAQLRGMLSDLGYETTDPGGGRITIEDQGQLKRNIDFVLNDDRTVLNIYAPLTDIDEGQKATIPMEALLKANDSSGPFAYALVSVEGKGRLDLEGYFDTGTVSKQMLRRTLDALVAAEDAGEPLWNADHWTASAAAASSPPKTLDTARAELEKAWENSPMRLQHASFVTEGPAYFGGYTKRPTTVFKAGETITAYMEPEGYAWKALAGDMKSTDISVDMVLSDTHGAVIADKKAFASKSFKTHGDILGVFFNLDLNLNGAPDGDYAVRYTMHDLNSDKSAEVTLPFTLASAK